MTQIPRALAEELDLQMITDNAHFYGATGHGVDAAVFVSNLRLGDLDFPYIEVVALDPDDAEGADDVLIGREILARLVATFDGPREQFILDMPGRPFLTRLLARFRR